MHPGASLPRYLQWGRVDVEDNDYDDGADDDDDDDDCISL